MGVRREEWIVTGIKLSDEWTSALFRDSNRFEKIEDALYDTAKFKETKISNILVDGMSGDYTFIGICKQISDGWDGDSYEIVEIEAPSPEQIAEIKAIWNKWFSGEDMPEIKNYYVPHFN
jgi:hypothetical protein